MVAGGAAQILGESFPKSQIDAGGPSKMLNPITNNLIEETAALEKKRDVLIAIYKTKATLFFDQTGRFPQQSSRGNNCQMILHDIDSNSTWVEPMENRTEGELILARRWALAQMKIQWIVRTHQVLDNEISKAYKTEIQATGMAYQLVPPNDHRHNIAEKAIQTWKDHFVGVLSGTSDTFPLHLWCQALPQMERQLLLLRQYNTNPKISAYAYVYGQYNYDAKPFVPIGMEILVHKKPHRLKCFAEHCKKDFVLGTSFEHYRAWTMWMKDTRATRVSGTIFHKHKYTFAPVVTPEDAVIVAVGRLAEALKGNLPHNLGKSSLDELTHLCTMFGQASAPTAPFSPLQPAQPSPLLGLPAPPPRRSPRLITTVTSDG